MKYLLLLLLFAACTSKQEKKRIIVKPQLRIEPTEMPPGGIGHIDSVGKDGTIYIVWDTVK